MRRAALQPSRGAADNPKVKKKGLTTVIGLGTVTAIFMAMMSMFYLQQIPTQADLDRLADDMRREHGLYLASAAPIDIRIMRPEREGERTGLRIECTMRPDLRKRPKTIEAYLERIAVAALEHPDWRGKIGWVTVAHTKPTDITVTRRVPPKQPDKSA